jgi:hypothetical protein
MGHALEVGVAGHPVRWSNRDGVQFEMIPGGGPKSQNTCREFKLVTARGKERSSRTGVACQSGQGVWRIKTS